MARIRAIKPGFFVDEDIAELSRDARLFFIGMWTHADKVGIIEDRPKQLLAKIFPHDRELTVDDTSKYLQELEQNGFILRYFGEGDGRKYIYIRNWDMHQRPHKYEGKSTKPFPSKDLVSTVVQPSANGISTEDSGRPTLIGKKENSKIGKKENETLPACEIITHGKIPDEDELDIWLEGFYHQWRSFTQVEIGMDKFKARTRKLLRLPEITLDLIKEVYSDRSNYAVHKIWDLESRLKERAGIVEDKPKAPAMSNADSIKAMLDKIDEDRAEREANAKSK